MTPDDLQKYIELLNARKEEAQRFLQQSSESSKPVDLGESIGRLTRMDAMQQQQLALAAVKKKETQIILIDQALQRIKDASFGLCLECGEEIAKKRLLARPEGPLCLECQEDQV